MSNREHSREELIGEKVIENRERRRRFINEHSAEWREQGRKYRNAREALRVTRKEMRQMIGASETTIASFEAGNPVLRRPLIESSYITALKFVELQRRPLVEAVAHGTIF